MRNISNLAPNVDIIGILVAHINQRYHQLLIKKNPYVHNYLI